MHKQKHIRMRLCICTRIYFHIIVSALSLIRFLFLSLPSGAVFNSPLIPLLRVLCCRRLLRFKRVFFSPKGPAAINENILVWVEDGLVPRDQAKVLLYFLLLFCFVFYRGEGREVGSVLLLFCFSFFHSYTFSFFFNSLFRHYAQRRRIHAARCFGS